MQSVARMFSSCCALLLLSGGLCAERSDVDLFFGSGVCSCNVAASEVSIFVSSTGADGGGEANSKSEREMD